MAELFGFKIERINDSKVDPRQNIVPPQADDGTQTVPAGGFFASYGGFDVNARNELDLIRRYREISLHPECDLAIEDIVSEAIVSNENQKSVQLDLSHVKYNDTIKKAIRESFDELIYPSEYGALVKQYRQNNLLTQEDFAIQSGIALRTVQNIEQGKSLYNKTIKKLNNFFEKQNEQTKKD